MKYKSIFISDVHIGSSHSNVDKLLGYLRDNDFDNIFLVGDIIDGWLLKSRWKWNASANLFVQKILKRRRHGANVVYLYGNHDDFLKDFEGVEFGGIRIYREYEYTTHGKNYILVHGDQFDGAVRFCPRLQKIGGSIYEISIFANSLLRVIGIKWSLSSYLKQKAKSAVKYLASYREALVSYARMKGAYGIILGHIHNPEISVVDGIHYINIGDMVESNTVVIEDTKGEFNIVRL